MKQGWSTAVVVFLLCCGFTAASSIPQVTRGSVPAIFVVAWACCSVLLTLIPLAMVSSRAQDTLTALNECRTIGIKSNEGIIDSDLKLSARIRVIEDYLQNLNKGQGPGAVLLEVVVDTKLLKAIAVTLWGSGAVAMSHVVELQARHAGEVADCELSDVQIETIKAAMFEANHTCKFDITVSDVIHKL